MPKELTHWIVAQKTARALPPGPAREAVERHPRLYLLGAVSPDTPMYAIYRARQMGDIARRLHGGEGENTFAPAATLMETLGLDSHPRAVAFLLGYLSHVMTDAVYHPLVMYYSGACRNPVKAVENENLFRHRLIESWMDVAYMQTHPREARFRYRGILREKHTPDIRLAELFSTLFHGRTGVGERAILGAVLCHGLFHDIFAQKLLARTAFKIQSRMPGSIRAYLPLFYPEPGTEPLALLEKPLAYRHPVTGRPREESLLDVESRAVASAARLFDILSQNLRQGTAAEFLKRTRGPSLETGIVGAGTSRLIHSDTAYDIDNLIF